MGKGSSVFFGVIFFVVGIIFLFRNAGLLDVSLLRQLAVWWYVGLIFAGLALILGRGGLGSAFLALTLVLAVVHAQSGMESFQETIFWSFPNVSIQGLNCISGSGNLSSEERATGGFTGVEASSGVNVYLTQAPERSVRVEADGNILPYVSTEVGNKVLKVSLKRCVLGQKSVNVYVSSKNIASLSAGSSAKIIGTSPLNGGELLLDASSAGQIDITVDAGSVNASSSSAGLIRLGGTAGSLGAEASSGGMVDAYSLQAVNVTAAANSAGIVQVFALDRLAAKADSAGKVQYKGSPAYVDAKESSAGIVLKVD